MQECGFWDCISYCNGEIFGYKCRFSWIKCLALCMDSLCIFKVGCFRQQGVIILTVDNP